MSIAKYHVIYTCSMCNDIKLLHVISMSFVVLCSRFLLELVRNMKSCHL